MIYHLTRFALKPDPPKDQLDRALEMMRRLGRELDVVEQWVVGRDFGGEFDIGAMYAVKDVDAYRTYMLSPLHRQIDEIGLPLVATGVSLDITDDEDPGVGAKIAEIHTNRFAADPGLVKLVEGMGSYEGSGTTKTV